MIDPFLYGLDDPERACRSSWLPSAQSRCLTTARKLKGQLARPPFRLPTRGKLPYAAGGVHGAAVSFVVGDRNPLPGESIFYGTFTLKRASDKWLIESFATP